MEDFIPTRVSMMKKNAAQDFVAVNYDKPKKKAKNTTAEKSKQQNSTNRAIQDDDTNIDAKRQQELEMKRARYEVIKFGMSGFEKVKARKVKVALAISLGAKPPKGKRTNYKALKTRRKTVKEEEKREEHVSGLSSSMKKHKARKIRKKVSSGILDVYGKVEKGGLSRKKS